MGCESEFAESGRERHDVRLRIAGLTGARVAPMAILGVRAERPLNRVQDSLATGACKCSVRTRAPLTLRSAPQAARVWREPRFCTAPLSIWSTHHLA